MQNERFSVEEYLKAPSRKVVTGKGDKVRILCTDLRSTYPVVAVVDDGFLDIIETYTEGGRCYEWKEEECDLYFEDKVERFDPNGLRPFDRVLVRDVDGEIWEPSLYGYKNGQRRYACTVEGTVWKMCVPYNDETRGLLGTDKDCPERYKWWED